MKGITELRGKACRRVLKAASKNDRWNMARYAEINRYLSELKP